MKKIKLSKLSKNEMSCISGGANTICCSCTCHCWSIPSIHDSRTDYDSSYSSDYKHHNGDDPISIPDPSVIR